jgi:predicted nucleic acid-binding protein
MIVVDASVIIALLDANDAHHARAADVLDDPRGRDWT